MGESGGWAFTRTGGAFSHLNLHVLQSPVHAPPVKASIYAQDKLAFTGGAYPREYGNFKHGLLVRTCTEYMYVTVISRASFLCES